MNTTDTAPWRLDGQVALVTGASRGIGLAVARSLASAGASVAMVGRSEITDKALASVPGERAFWCCDVSDPNAVKATVKAVVDRFGSLSVLINNAGIALNGLVLRVSDEQWARVLGTNLAGAFHCTRAAGLHLLRARQRGRVVNISSVVGELGNPGQAAYSASKAGLEGLTRTTAREFAARGVTVNAVSPGFVDTDMTRDNLPAAQREQFLAQVPLGRIGSVEDVAGVVLFLCSDAASYITGQVIRVNGGMTV